MQDAIQELAEIIKSDEVLASVPGLSVVIEDDTDVSGEYEKAMASFGVAVVIVATGFARRSQSGEMLTGDLQLAIDAVENSQLNRLQENPGFWTAQRVSVRLSRLLHWRKLETCVGRICFKSMNRADVRGESAIMRSIYAVEHDLGDINTTEY